MIWWLVITLLVAGALTYGYRSHQRERRRLEQVFGLLVSERQGRVKPGNWLVFPQLQFEEDDRTYLVTAMASPGTRSGDSGPFTFVALELPFDTGHKIRIKKGTDAADLAVDALAPGRRITTGHQAFDEAFRVDTSSEVFAASLLELGVRQRLLQSGLPRLDVRVKGKKIDVHMDGIANSKEEIEELIDIASVVAKHCPANR